MLGIPAPRLVKAPVAVVAPVPPLATGTALPFQVPEVIVPTVVIEDEPARGDNVASAANARVFSTPTAESA